MLGKSAQAQVGQSTIICTLDMYIIINLCLCKVCINKVTCLHYWFLPVNAHRLANTHFVLLSWVNDK